MKNHLFSKIFTKRPLHLILAALFCLIAVFSCVENTAEAQVHPGFYVQGRYLYDYQGNKVTLIGANVMTKYWDAYGNQSFASLSQTGANVARIFWNTDSAVGIDIFDATIQNAIDHNMIPMPCLWDATGDWSKLWTCVNWWMQPQVLQIIQKYEKYIIINIANEAGTGAVSMQEYESTYKQVITAMRNAGIRVPLVIDAGNWGRNENYILNTAQALIQHDPLKNLLFSWHPWDDGMPNSRYKNTIDAAVQQNIPFIVGEFSHTGVNYNTTHDWEYLVNYCLQKDVGWLAWVWRGASSTDGHNITNDYIYGNWTSWGEELVPYIQNNSVRPPMLGGSVTPPSTNKYEAENAQLTGVSVGTSVSGYSGDGHIEASSLNQSGDRIRFIVNSDIARTYTLKIRYAGTHGDKHQYVSVNGNSVYTLFPGTSGWEDLNFGEIQLNAGSNTIDIIYSWGWSHFDYIEIQGDIQPPPTTKYEAENAQLTGVSVGTSLPGYSGNGHIEASSLDQSGDRIRFNVSISTSGAYYLKIRYAGTHGDKRQYVSINGNSVYTLFPGTSGWEDLNFGEIQLNAGSNTIDIIYSWGWNHFDYIEIVPV